MATQTDEQRPANRQHSLEERFSAAAERLTPGEQTVGRYLADHPDEVLFLSAADIARALNVSDATVIRTAQALGYAGLPGLKEELRASVQARMTPVARLARSLDEAGDNPDAVLDYLASAEIELLAEARRSLRGADFRHAVDLLVRADRVAVFGSGPNSALALHFIQALRRFGRRTHLIAGRGMALADDLMELGTGDVLVAIAYEVATEEVTVALDHALELQVPCVLVTDTLALALAGKYAVALSARRGDTDLMPTGAIPLVIIEALLLGVAGRDRARTLAAVAQLAELRAKLAPSR